MALAKIYEKCKDTKDDFDVHNVQCIKKDWSQTLKFFAAFSKFLSPRVRLVLDSWKTPVQFGIDGKKKDVNWKAKQDCEVRLLNASVFDSQIMW